MCINCGLTYGCMPGCHLVFKPGPEEVKVLQEVTAEASSSVNHPQHYGGDTPYEAIKVMIAWDAQMAYHFCIGNAIKYFSRLGKKDPEKVVEDLKKAGWYATKAADIFTEHLSEAADDKYTEAIKFHEGAMKKVVDATSPPFGVNLGEGRAWHGGGRD